MTGEFYLDWAIMAVSLFNTILALWLGLTVLLSAQHRTWGIWLAGLGLMMGGLFFISHTAILGRDFFQVTQGTELWWAIGWLPVIALPLAWYILTLWYAGFWGDGAPGLPIRQRLWFIISTPFAGHTALHKRHRVWYAIIVVWAVILTGMVIFAGALPTYWQIITLNLTTQPAIAGVPLLLLAYPLYILLCMVLSLDVLRHPEPSPRVMGDLARRRARPWLMAVSMVLLLAGLLVTIFIISVALSTQYRTTASIISLVTSVGWFDLIISALIGLAIVFLGQAIVTYELFTGTNLPRRGFARHWQRVIILAAGYGVVVGGSLTLQLRPIYSLLLTAIIMVTFYALLVWRSFADRERFMAGLRPFVASQRLYEQLLSPTTPPELDVNALFRALCEDVLDAKTATLIPLGPLAPLAGSPLGYPPNLPSSPPPLANLLPQFDSPQTMCVPLDSTGYDGAMWAIPLWSERGLIGVLLLGEKRDGGLYAQEEIEIARTSGERLIDTQAGAEMARRLMALQRQRLAETQVVDRQTRRVLHDDVLPQLHASLLTLSSKIDPADEPSNEALSSLSNAHWQISNLLHEIPAATAPQIARRGLIEALRQTVDDEFATAFDTVNWEIATETETRSRAIPTLTAEVIFYAAREAIRNAARHGRADEAQLLELRIAVTWHDGLEIIIEDNGVGLTGSGKASAEANGKGLALHSTMMSVIGGTLAVESMPGEYTQVRLSLPRNNQR